MGKAEHVFNYFASEVKTVELEDGSIFKGTFVGGKRTGPGVIKYPDGTSYEGDFVNGEITGTGTKYTKEGDKRYEGQWMNGKREGKGTEWNQDPGTRYEGDFVDDMFHGKGTMYLADRTVEGLFSYNEIHGKAKIYNFDGSIIHALFNKGRYVHVLENKDSPHKNS